MSKIYVETKWLEPGLPITADLARHFLTREREGAAIVLTDKVDGTLAAFAKRWKRLIVAMQVERARTLDAYRIQTLNQQIKRMERLRFFHTLPSAQATTGIYFVKPTQVTQAPILCATVYVLEGIGQSQIDMLRQNMKPQSLLVLYQRRA